MSSALGERLRRLRRSDAAVPERPAPAAPEGLARLEARLIGAADDDGLSLKERLERLVAVAARRPRVNGFAPAGPPLEELLSGRRVENARGEFFLVEDDVHLETLHGAVPFTRLRRPRSAPRWESSSTCRWTPCRVLASTGWAARPRR